jgi:hypothetical protein
MRFADTEVRSYWFILRELEVTDIAGFMLMRFTIYNNLIVGIRN